MQHKKQTLKEQTWILNVAKVSTYYLQSTVLGSGNYKIFYLLIILGNVLESRFSPPKFRLLLCQTGCSKTKYEICSKPQYYPLYITLTIPSVHHHIRLCHMGPSSSKHARWLGLEMHTPFPIKFMWKSYTQGVSNHKWWKCRDCVN